MVLVVLGVVLVVLEVVLVVLAVLTKVFLHDCTYVRHARTWTRVPEAAWFISNFQKTVNRLVLAALMSYRPGAKIFLYKSTVLDRLEWVPGL